MRLYEGILRIVYSLLIVLILVLFFDFSVVIDWFLAVFLLTVSVFLFLPGLKIVLYYIICKRIEKHKIRTKAKIVDVKRSILDFRDHSAYILEVLYFNPITKKDCHAYANYDGDTYGVNMLKENAAIDIYIDPKNSNVVLIA